jgi:hypothetical protein
MLSADQLMLYAFFGILVLVGLFALLALVRIWSGRMQARDRASANVDLERLKAQLDAGALSPEEYAAIRRRLMGRAADKPADVAALEGLPPVGAEGGGRSITQPGNAGQGPEKEPSDGQG